MRIFKVSLLSFLILCTSFAFAKESELPILENLKTFLSKEEIYQYTRYGFEGDANEQGVKIRVLKGDTELFNQEIKAATKRIVDEWASEAGDEWLETSQFQFRMGRVDLEDQILADLREAIKYELKKEFSWLVELHKRPSSPLSFEIFQGGIWGDGGMEILGDEVFIIKIKDWDSKTSYVIVIEFSYCHC